MGEFNQTKYQNEYIRKNYSRLTLAIPKNKREEYDKKAKQKGTSLTKLICKLLDEYDPTAPEDASSEPELDPDLDEEK